MAECAAKSRPHKPHRVTATRVPEFSGRSGAQSPRRHQKSCPWSRRASASVPGSTTACRSGSICVWIVSKNSRSTASRKPQRRTRRIAPHGVNQFLPNEVFFLRRPAHCQRSLSCRIEDAGDRRERRDDPLIGSRGRIVQQIAIDAGPAALLHERPREGSPRMPCPAGLCPSAATLACSAIAPPTVSASIIGMA